MQYEPLWHVVQGKQIIHDEDTLQQALDYAVKMKRVGLVNKLKKFGLQEQEVQPIFNEVAAEESQESLRSNIQKCFSFLAGFEKHTILYIDQRQN